MTYDKKNSARAGVDEGARTYPREWFRVTKHGSKAEALTFQRETEKMLFTGTRRVAKVTSWETWYPTREEAAAALAKVEAAKSQRRRANRIATHGEELVEALRETVGLIGAPSDFRGLLDTYTVDHTITVSIGQVKRWAALLRKIEGDPE